MPPPHYTSRPAALPLSHAPHLNNPRRAARPIDCPGRRRLCPRFNQTKGPRQTEEKRNHGGPQSNPVLEPPPVNHFPHTESRVIVRVPRAQACGLAGLRVRGVVGERRPLTRFASVDRLNAKSPRGCPARPSRHPPLRFGLLRMSGKECCAGPRRWWANAVRPYGGPDTGSGLCGPVLSPYRQGRSTVAATNSRTGPGAPATTPSL